MKMYFISAVFVMIIIFAVYFYISGKGYKLQNINNESVKEDYVKHGSIRRKSCGCVERYDINWRITGECLLHENPVIKFDP